MIFAGPSEGFTEDLIRLAKDAAEGFVGVYEFGFADEDLPGVNLMKSVTAKLHGELESEYTAYIIGWPLGMIAEEAIEHLLVLRAPKEQLDLGVAQVDPVEVLPAHWQCDRAFARLAGVELEPLGPGVAVVGGGLTKLGLFKDRNCKDFFSEAFTEMAASVDKGLTQRISMPSTLGISPMTFLLIRPTGRRSSRIWWDMCPGP
jgi:hypothetical protein